MKRSPAAATSIDEYITTFPAAVQARMKKLRATIRKAAPDAGEKIAYRMPTFTHHGNLVHFAGFARHIGFYPGPTGIARFQGELTPYKNSRGAVQFQHDEPLPLDLVTRIVKFRVAESLGIEE